MTIKAIEKIEDFNGVKYNKYIVNFFKEKSGGSF